MNRAFILGALALVTCWLGCANGNTSIPDPQQRLRSAEEIAAEAGFERLESMATSADVLPVVAWIRRSTNSLGPKAGLHIYIEGDGFSWRSRRRVSLDPTPVHPIGLTLAAVDASPATTVYLGRPCQYGIPASSACRPIFWTAARYGEVAIDAMSQHIDALLAALDHRNAITLIGYSGGGVVAALLAARRNDVVLLVTIAAPLDVEAWTVDAQVSPLVASLSPMDEVGPLRRTRQHHFVGREDDRVPIALTQAFHRALGPDALSTLTIVEDMDHRSWPRVWEGLVESTGLLQ